MMKKVMELWKKWFGEKEVLKQESQASYDLHTPSPSREGNQASSFQTLWCTLLLL